MKLLQEAEDKRKKEKDCFDIFGSLPQEELVWKHGGESKKQKVHVLADEEREAELKKEKYIKEKEAKEKKKLESEEFKRKRKETQNETSKKRKLASSFASEHKNADRSRKPIGFIEALPVHHGKGKTSCGE